MTLDMGAWKINKNSHYNYRRPLLATDVPLRKTGTERNCGAPRCMELDELRAHDVNDRNAVSDQSSPSKRLRYLQSPPLAGTCC